MKFKRPLELICVEVMIVVTEQPVPNLSARVHLRLGARTFRLHCYVLLVEVTEVKT
jgi:hypothetical protein